MAVYHLASEISIHQQIVLVIIFLSLWRCYHCMVVVLMLNDNCGKKKYIARILIVECIGRMKCFVLARFTYSQLYIWCYMLPRFDEAFLGDLNWQENYGMDFEWNQSIAVARGNRMGNFCVWSYGRSMFIWEWVSVLFGFVAGKLSQTRQAVRASTSALIWNWWCGSW